jgi:hypothetical protein
MQGRDAEMWEREIAYIRTEPIHPAHQQTNGPTHKCIIELGDGSTIIRCGFTEQHALANAIACYKTSFRQQR